MNADLYNFTECLHKATHIEDMHLALFIIKFESNVYIISSLLHAHHQIFLDWYFYIEQTIETHVNFVVRLFHSPGYILLLVN